MDVVAEHQLDIHYADSAIVPVHVRIGRPRPDLANEGVWGCVVQVEGLRLWEGQTELFGEGSLHALMIAAGFLHGLLSAEVERGAVLHWQNGWGTLDLDRLFVLPVVRAAAPEAS